VTASAESGTHGVVEIDAERRPVRIVTDANLLLRAGDVMTSPVVTVRDCAPVIEALTLSATKHLKRRPAVDAGGRLVGVAGRPALLGASLDLARGS